MPQESTASPGLFNADAWFDLEYYYCDTDASELAEDLPAQISATFGEWAGVKFSDYIQRHPERQAGALDQIRDDLAMAKWIALCDSSDLPSAANPFDELSDRLERAKLKCPLPKSWPRVVSVPSTKISEIADIAKVANVARSQFESDVLQSLLYFVEITLSWPIQLLEEQIARERIAQVARSSCKSLAWLEKLIAHVEELDEPARAEFSLRGERQEALDAAKPVNRGIAEVCGIKADCADRVNAALRAVRSIHSTAKVQLARRAGAPRLNDPSKLSFGAFEEFVYHLVIAVYKNGGIISSDKTNAKGSLEKILRMLLPYMPIPSKRRDNGRKSTRSSDLIPPCIGEEGATGGEDRIHRIMILASDSLNEMVRIEGRSWGQAPFVRLTD